MRWNICLAFVPLPVLALGKIKGHLRIALLAQVIGQRVDMPSDKIKRLRTLDHDRDGNARIMWGQCQPNFAKLFWLKGDFDFPPSDRRMAAASC